MSVQSKATLHREAETNDDNEVNLFTDTLKPELSALTLKFELEKQRKRAYSSGNCG
jgi:hypothetical protein